MIINISVEIYSAKLRSRLFGIFRYNSPPQRVQSARAPGGISSRWNNMSHSWHATRSVTITRPLFLLAYHKPARSKSLPECRLYKSHIGHIGHIGPYWHKFASIKMFVISCFPSRWVRNLTVTKSPRLHLTQLTHVTAYCQTSAPQLLSRRIAGPGQNSPFNKRR